MLKGKTETAIASLASPVDPWDEEEPWATALKVVPTKQGVASWEPFDISHCDGYEVCEVGMALS